MGIEKALFIKVTIFYRLFFSQNLTMGVFESDFFDGGNRFNTIKTP